MTEFEEDALRGSRVAAAVMVPAASSGSTLSRLRSAEAATPRERALREPFGSEQDDALRSSLFFQDLSSRGQDKYWKGVMPGRRGRQQGRSRLRTVITSPSTGTYAAAGSSFPTLMLSTSSQSSISSSPLKPTIALCPLFASPAFS